MKIQRVLTLVSVVVVMLLGFGAKCWRGPLAHWLNDSFAGFFYVVFWCLAVFLVHPRRPRLVALWILAVTCALEFSQLWHPAWLDAWRRHFLVHALIGSYFDWSDFPYYFAGALTGWAWMSLLEKSARGAGAQNGKLPHV
jgi:hypothetical protein